MLTLLKLCLLLVYLQITLQLELIYHNSIDPLNNSTTIKYSPLDSLLVISNSTGYRLVETYTGYPMFTYIFNTNKQNCISTLEFSENGNFLGVGFNYTNYGYISYFINITSLNPIEFRLGGDGGYTEDVVDVRGVGFFRQDYFINVLSNGSIYIRKTTKDSQVLHFPFQNYEFLRLEVIDHPNNIMMTVARKSNESDLLFVTFQYKQTTNQLKQINSIPIDFEQLTVITDMQVNKAGTKLYFVGNTQNTYYVNIQQNNTIQISQIPAKSEMGYLSIQLSDDEKFVLLVNQTHLQYVSNYSEEENQENQVYLIVELIQAPLATLSHLGGTLLFPKNNKFVLEGLCPKQEYLVVDQQYQCKRCSKGCDECITEQKCFSCQMKYFNKNYTCSNCPQHCSYCNSSSYCYFCDDTFVLNKSACVCLRGQYLKFDKCMKCAQNCYDCTDQKNCKSCNAGYFPLIGLCTKCPQSCTFCSSPSFCTSCVDGYILVDNQCKQESDLWLIFLIVGIVIVLLIITFFGFKKYREKKRKNPLLQNQQEQFQTTT